jgi:hypothetical protein
MPRPAVAGAGLAELHSLVSKSLLRRAGVGRFELHELLRNMPRAAGGEQVEFAEARASHASFYAGMIAERADALLGDA